MSVVRSAMKEHFCSLDHEERNAPCDLCLAQREKIRNDQCFAEGKPTLQHNPFAKLLKKPG